MSPAWLVPVRVIALGLGVTSGASGQVATRAMVGRWIGEAKIVVDWTTAKTLDVDVTIDSTDRVRGTIGDATLLEGRLVRNRGRLARLLNIKTDYLITGRLEGPIIAAERITRERVSMPLSWIDDQFAGGLATSGTKLGGAESMVLSASRLTLRRPEH